MKRTIFIFGGIAGLVITAQMLFAVSQCYTNPDWQPNDYMGYAGMVIAFSLIFVGIRSYRDNYEEGIISFGKALKTGLYITVVASAIYVIVWVIDYYIFVPDFMDRYSAFVMKEAARDGEDQVKKAAEMAQFKEMYKNPLFVVLITFMEVFPVGLIISVISALILKRKRKQNVEPVID